MALQRETRVGTYGTGTYGGYGTPDSYGAADSYGSGYDPAASGASGSTPVDDGGQNPLYYVPDTVRYGAQTEKQMLELQAKLAADAEAARWARIAPSMDSLFSSTSAAGAPGPAISYGGADLTAKQEAAFARAKDRAGMLARSADTSVRENAAARGVLGAGFETEEVAKRAIAPSMNVLGDLNARQMAEAYQAASHGADVAYQGAIEQRGQDQSAKLSSMNALLSAMRGFL